MLAPKRIRHRKVQRGSMKGKAKGYTQLHHGSYGIQALEPHWITNRQIEAARIAMTRYMKRGGKVWIASSPTSRSPEACWTRMGSGRVTRSLGCCREAGRIMFEIDGVDEATAKEALRLAINKLPIKCKIVSKETEVAK
ncbi:MAG: 50S ribosomal protein L16 [Eggerthellaceae bacterium]